nr:hypothetical protein [Candidatus Woesebacteria bacterium]
MTLHKVLFHKDYLNEVLGAFGDNIDKEGFIIDSSGDRVLTKKTEEIHSEEFAGIAKGSRIYVKSDITSLIEYIE